MWHFLFLTHVISVDTGRIYTVIDVIVRKLSSRNIVVRIVMIINRTISVHGLENFILIFNHCTHSRI